MSDKYDTHTGPTTIINYYLWDLYYFKLVRKSRKKIKDLHQILENDKGGWFYAEVLQKNCRFVLHYFQARA